jgi:hypothetical protein
VAALGPDQFHGPGVAHTGYGEYNQRELLTRWADHMEQPIERAATLEVGGDEQVSVSQQGADRTATPGTGTATAQDNSVQVGAQS